MNSGKAENKVKNLERDGMAFRSPKASSPSRSPVEGARLHACLCFNSHSEGSAGWYRLWWIPHLAGRPALFASRRRQLTQARRREPRLSTKHRAALKLQGPEPHYLDHQASRFDSRWGLPVASRSTGRGGPIEITQTTFDRWNSKYGGLGVPELQELRQLRDENRKLKQLVAGLSLDKTILQESLRKKL